MRTAKSWQKQTGEHIFSSACRCMARVELKAVAGDCIDTACFRSVATPNPGYKLVKTRVQECKLGINKDIPLSAVVIHERRRTNEYQKPKVRLWSVLTALTAILTIAAIVGNMIANQYATTLNVALNASTYKIIKGNTTEDTEYFKAGFTSDEEREAYEAELCATVEAEGAPC